MLTLSIIKADTGGFVGRSAMHPAMLKTARAEVERARGELLVDAQVASCGDDLHLVMTHRLGPDAVPVHELAWDVFQQTTAKAKELGLHGAGQDLLSDAFSGSVIKSVRPRTLGEVAAVTSTQRLALMAGRYIGKDDPILIVRARATANEIMDHLRRHGPFEPHRLPLDEMEDTTMPGVVKRLADRWEPIENAVPVVVP